MISVIIPTFNRYDDLLRAVHSVQTQTWNDIEIIIVDDASTDPRYEHLAISGCQIFRLPENTCALFGFPCAGYVRNCGAKRARGEWLAFLDDDDLWLPQKLQRQMEAIGDLQMSCTEGYINPFGIRYNREFYWDYLKQIYGPSGLLQEDFPSVWTKDFLDIHNCVITSSALIHTGLFWELKGFLHAPNGEEDCDLWQRASVYTDCHYVNEPCFVYSYRWTT